MELERFYLLLYTFWLHESVASKLSNEIRRDWAILVVINFSFFPLNGQTAREKYGHRSCSLIQTRSRRSSRRNVRGCLALGFLYILFTGHAGIFGVFPPSSKLWRFFIYIYVITRTYLSFVCIYTLVRCWYFIPLTAIISLHSSLLTRLLPFILFIT